MKEREIDLLDMIADILSHWRGLLIAVVLGAILMGHSAIRDLIRMHRICSHRRQKMHLRVRWLWKNSWHN